MKKIIILFLMLFCFQSVFAASPQCDAYYNAQKYSAASSCYEQYLNSKPSDNQARVYYGYSLWADGQKEKAAYQFNYILTRRHDASPQIKALAQKGLAGINKIKNEETSAVKNDYGNYITELSSTKGWATMPVRVWIQPGPYYTAAQNAFSEWYQATNGVVRFTQTQSESQARIKVYFVDKVNNTNELEAGVCKTQYAGNYISSAIIYVGVKSLSGETLPSNKVYPIVLHEIGHALGIAGHSSVRNDVMYPNTNIIGIHTSRRDVNTIKAIYKK